MEAAKRECMEETGLLPVSLIPRGFIEFYFREKPEWNQKCFIFVGREWTGDLIETEGTANMTPYQL
jgi:8-oxo-dGTP pyrophosphatase MutT (NUDIX family)